MFVKKILVDESLPQIIVSLGIQIEWHERSILFKNQGNAAFLADVINNGETVDRNCLYLFVNDEENVVYLFGGENSYRVNLKSFEVSLVKTHRELVWDEYWSEYSILYKDNFVFIIYESGILMLTSDFNILLNEPKSFDEYLSSLSDDRLELKDANENTRIILTDFAIRHNSSN